MATDKERLGFERSGAADLIKSLHANKAGEAIKHVLVNEGVLSRDEPLHPDQIADPAERERALGRARLAAMYAGDLPANKSDEPGDVQKTEPTTAPTVRKDFAGTWLPGMTREEQRVELAKLTRRVASRG